MKSPPSMPIAHEWLAVVLEGWANQTAARFCAPVYLVGSALVETHPRDVDLVIILPLEDFVARYGDPTEWRWQSLMPEWSDGSLRWAADVAKLGGFCSRVHKLNIDLKIQPRNNWHAGKARMRLDKIPGVEDAS